MGSLGPHGGHPHRQAGLNRRQVTSNVPQSAVASYGSPGSALNAGGGKRRVDAA
jgi:hypothetical protein